jgi:hypothetical protein
MSSIRSAASPKPGSRSAERTWPANTLKVYTEVVPRRPREVALDTASQRLAQ